MRVNIVHDHGDSLTSNPERLINIALELEQIPPIGSEIFVNGHERVVTRIVHVVHVLRNGDAALVGITVSTKNRRSSSLG